MRTNRNEEQKAKLMELVSMQFDLLQENVNQLDQKILQVDDNSSHKKSEALKNMKLNEISSYLLAKAHQKQRQSENRSHPFIKWFNYTPTESQQQKQIKWFQEKEATLENCRIIISRLEEERDQSLRSTQQNLSQINQEMLKLKKSLSDIGIGENQGAQVDNHRDNQQEGQACHKIDRLDELEGRQKLQSCQNNQIQKSNIFESEQKVNKEHEAGNKLDNQSDKLDNEPHNLESQKDESGDKENPQLRQHPQSSNELKISQKKQVQQSDNPTKQQQQESKQQKVLDPAKGSETNQNNQQQKLEYYQQNKEVKQDNIHNKYQQIFEETHQDNDSQRQLEKQQHDIRDRQEKQQHPTQDQSQQKNREQGQQQQQKNISQYQSRQQIKAHESPELKQSKVESPQKRKSIFQISSEFNEVISTKKYYENVKNSKDSQKSNQLQNEEKQDKQMSLNNNLMSQQLSQYRDDQEQIKKQEKIPLKPVIIETETTKIIKKLDSKLHKIYVYYFKQTNAKKKGFNFDQKPQGLDLNTFIQYLKDFQLAEAVEIIVGRNNIKDKISPNKKKKGQEKIDQTVNIEPVTIKNKKGSKKSVSQNQVIPMAQVTKQKQLPNKRKQKKSNLEDKQIKIEQPKKQQSKFIIDYKLNEHPHLKYHHNQIIQYLTKLFKKLAINSLWLDQSKFHMLHDDVFQLKQEKQTYLNKIQQIKSETQDQEQQQTKMNDVPVPIQFTGTLKEIHKFISEQKIHKFLNINVINHISNLMHDHPDRLRSIVEKHTHSNGQNYEQHREQMILKIRRNKQDQQRKHQMHAQKILQRYKQQQHSRSLEQQLNKNSPNKSKSMQKINSYAKVMSLQKQKQVQKRRYGYALQNNLPKIQSEQQIKTNNLHDQTSVQSDNLKKNDSNGSPKSPKTLQKRIQIYRELNLPKLSKRKLREQSIYEQLGQIQLKGQSEKIKRLISEADQKDNSLVVNNKSYLKNKKKKKIEDDLDDDQLFKEYFQHEKTIIQKDRQKERPILKNRMKFT